tara:strand:- start:249 stop:1928 length:1680 start_codon:yes stop_codon:yes gene_type:complete
VPVAGVKLTMEYFIDKRVFVTGRKSVLGLDNPFNLTAFTNSQISLMGVSCAQNGLNIQTALDPITGTQTNCTELGGSLLSDTTITGNSTYNLSLLDINSLTLKADSFLNILTPSIGAATNGYVLTLVNSGTGECEWQAVPSGGENNTASNVGGGEGVFKQKNGIDLEFKTLTEGAGITLVSSLDEIEITNSGLLNVGLGLTESPTGTVKLGGVGIGSSENLEVANAGLWEVKESGTVADTNLSLGIGTNPLYGPGIISDISTTGTQATTGIVNPAVGFSFEIIADNYGTIGNSIVITTDGANTIEQLVIDWNLLNPSNTATVIYYLGSNWGPLSTGVSHTLSGGSGLIPSTAISAVLATYPPQPIMYQAVPSQNFERFISFDTSIVISSETDNLRSLITVNSDQGITLSARDTGAADMYIDLDLTSGVRFGNSNSPAYSYDFPTVDGLVGQSLVNDGGNAINWEDSINVVSTAINYTANYKEVVLVSTGATDKDITLPLAARANQQITIKKIDVGVGVVHILGNGVETIDGVNDQPLNSQYEVMTVVSNGTEWFVISYN